MATERGSIGGHGGAGFTLIELIVAMTIVAILAAIAIPSYTQYVTRSKRAAAATVLIETAGALERNFTTNGCYNKTTVAACRDQSAGNDFVLGPLARAPREGRASYLLTVDTFGVRGQTFTLTATPCANAVAPGCAAPAENFADAICGNLTLTHAAQRGISGSGTVAQCWQR